MRKLALIQNQSEMAHYGYADCRPLFLDFGYQPVLYTAQNIERLSSDLSSGIFDSVILGSNALNDMTIREVVYSESFAMNLKSFLLSGNGLVILHQLRIAQQADRGETAGILSFLPVRHPIKLHVRPKADSAIRGNLAESAGVARHFSLVYPEQVNLKDLTTRAVDGPSLKGLYWHYLADVNEVEWDTVVHDAESPNKRSLIAVTKETEPYRIVVSALPLDWQRQTDLFSNLCLFATEGSHRTAIYGGHDIQADTTFAYLLETLRSRKFPFRHYSAQEKDKLQQNIETGAHSVLLTSADEHPAALDGSLGVTVRAAIQNGRLRMLGVDRRDGIKQLFMIGREREALRQLGSLLIQYTVDLTKGYIDGSFFSTVESLQIIHEFGITQSSTFLTPRALDAVLREIEDHDRNGSYDEVFHPSCALLWLRAKCFGAGDNRTQETIQWIRQRLEKHMLRERVLALHALLQIGVATDEEQKELCEALKSQAQQSGLSELDIIFYLQVSVAAKQQQAASDYLHRLLPFQSQPEGAWIDLATTATAVSATLGAMKLGIKGDQQAFYEALHRAISFIHFARSRGGNEGAYSWDSKATTSLRCLSALVAFEETIDQPIHEVAEMLTSLSRTAARNTVTEKALLLVQQLKQEHADMAVHMRDALSRSSESLSQSKKTEASLLEELGDQKKDISKLKRERSKLLTLSHLEVGFFWILVPTFLVLSVAGLISLLVLFLQVPANATKPVGEILKMVFSEGYLKAAGACIGALAPFVAYFALKRLGVAKSESKE